MKIPSIPTDIGCERKAGWRMRIRGISAAFPPVKVVRGDETSRFGPFQGCSGKSPRLALLGSGSYFPLQNRPVSPAHLFHLGKAGISPVYICITKQKCRDEERTH
ncbi:hypothetical protein IR083_18455 [Dysgonomonas sp. GY75]|uniref:hypothetical protein n=1 Tax=Dysgonomonas sp. GY75 TaxID=2780419 RepID=UPI00188426C6|nr:hypothetical protein [Dysgonomonas sp. GY75]MBF0650804.1 hypothetical protein [Dysgonomonas sp. GY75]